jgi:putative restriction endonuclease
VTSVVFYPADATFRPPPSFAPNIVQGKTYDLSDQAASQYFEFSHKIHIRL